MITFAEDFNSINIYNSYGKFHKNFNQPKKNFWEITSTINESLGLSFEGTKGLVVSAQKMANSVTATASKVLDGGKLAGAIGKDVSLLSAGFGIINFANSDKGKWSDYGKLGVSLLTAGLTYFPPTTVIGLALSGTEITGNIDGFYDMLDTETRFIQNNWWNNYSKSSR